MLTKMNVWYKTPTEQIRVNINIVDARNVQIVAKTFTQVLQREVPGAISIRGKASPRIIGSNLVVCIDEDEHKKGLEEVFKCLIGHSILSKDDRPCTTSKLQTKLSAMWGISEISR